MKTILSTKPELPEYVGAHRDAATLVGRRGRAAPISRFGVGDVSSWHTVARIAEEKSRQSGSSALPFLVAESRCARSVGSHVAACRLWIIPIFVLIASVSAFAQPQQAWVARYNGGFTNQIHTSLALALDHSGNIYVAGSSQNASNLYDYVILKYASSGVQLFAARYSSTNGANYTVNGFALDQNGNTYETGTGGTVKFSTNGTLAWSAAYSGNDMAVDTNGNEYVTGFSSSTYATVKLDSSGSNLWLRTHININGYTPAVSQKVAVDNAGNVYVAGYEAWEYISNHGNPYYYYQPSILMYDGFGNPVWTNAYTGERFGTTTGLIADNQGNVYVTQNGDMVSTGRINYQGQTVWGYAYGSAPPVMTFDTNGNVYITSYLTVKLDGNSGNVVWSKYQGAFLADSIALDKEAEVYVAGVTNAGANGNDFITMKYDGNGNQLWVLHYNGPANGNDGANAIAIAPDGSVYVTGYSANASGGIDIVTIKYSLLTLQRRSDGTVILQAQGSPGESFDIQASTNLLNWLDLGSVLADTNGLMQFDDTNAPAYPSRFYYTAPQ
jgi:hypothetical protein